MKMTVYLPEDLAAEVKNDKSINVSGVLQEALRRELGRRAALAPLDGQMGPVRVFDAERGRDVEFVGALIGRHEDGSRAYLTERHRIAVHDASRDRLWIYSTFDEFQSHWDDPHATGTDLEFVAAVASTLNEDYVVKLDI